MGDEAKMSMIMCSELQPAEQEKVARLDGPISEKFTNAGCVVRVCQGRIDDERRVLDFCGPTGTVVASVDATEFLAASDTDAMAMITIGDAA